MKIANLDKVTNQRRKPDNTYDPFRAIARWESEGGALQVAHSPTSSNLNLTVSGGDPRKKVTERPR